jgi:hypothetical protein
MQSERFTVTVQDGERGRLFVPVPFDPDEVWGPKTHHRVGGTVKGLRVRGVVGLYAGAQGFLLGPAWVRDCGVGVGDAVDVVIGPEGPQRDELPEDVAAALAASPQAGTFFDSLAQFYRAGYLRWINATKRSPELRTQRITEMIGLLELGIKDYGKR